MLVNYEQEWLQALEKDIGKSHFEGYATEFAVLLNELDYVERHLGKWMKPRCNHCLKLGSLSKRTCVHIPLGSILIINRWNYPPQLTLMPVIGALACGNRCFIKLSEHASATAELLELLVAAYFPEDWLKVVNSDAAVSQELLQAEWDLVFFTGSRNVGQSCTR